jgi:hypothetical protein
VKDQHTGPRPGSILVGEIAAQIGFPAAIIDVACLHEILRASSKEKWNFTPV